MGLFGVVIRTDYIAIKSILSLTQRIYKVAVQKTRACWKVLFYSTTDVIVHKCGNGIQKLIHYFIVPRFYSCFVRLFIRDGSFAVVGRQVRDCDLGSKGILLEYPYIQVCSLQMLDEASDCIYQKKKSVFDYSYTCVRTVRKGYRF